MNTREEFTIENSGNFQPLVMSNSFDTTLIVNNPSLKVLYQQAVIAEQNKKVETASAMPDLNVGYFNQSLIGVQNINGADVNFDGSKRFQGFNVGLSIPITFFSNASKVKSLSYKQQALQTEADNGKLILQSQLCLPVLSRRWGIAGIPICGRLMVRLTGYSVQMPTIH